MSDPRQQQMASRQQACPHAHQRAPEPVPQSPRLLKLVIAATSRTSFDVEPEDYLAAIAELLFSTICVSFLITYFTNHEMLENNPIRNMVGYNNPCAFWDQPPALYFASFMFCPMVHLAFRYAALDSARARMSESGGGMAFRCYRWINWLYAMSQVLLMGIFVITPQIPGLVRGQTTDDLHWFMRVHSGCFLQFVPILCLAMSSNYIEAYTSADKAGLSCKQICILIFYIVATILETIFATYAIFWYKGDYQPNTPDFFVVNPTVMQTIDYMWFLSLPFAASSQPKAPNLFYSYTLEGDGPKKRDLDEDFDQENGALADEVEPYVPDTDFTNDRRCVCGFACLCWLVPIGCIIGAIFPNIIPGSHKWLARGWDLKGVLGVVGIGVPLVAMAIILAPISPEADKTPIKGGWTGFRLNGATFGFFNYYKKMGEFAKKAASKDWRVNYAQWFADQTETDENVGEQFGGNTKMYYTWQDCVDKLQNMGDNIASDNVKRESELALAVMNNLMWPEAGRFALGFDNKTHFFVRPLMVRMFDGAQNQADGWDLDSLRSQFNVLFADRSEIHNDLVSRNMWDVVSPSRSKTVVTQMCLKVLHKVAIDMDIDDKDAEELAALQTTQLAPATCPARVAKTFCVWSCLAGPARAICKNWIHKYKVKLQERFPQECGRWSGKDLDDLASGFLDAMLQAGGRSVPLAIDLVMGYMLSSNMPDSSGYKDCLAGLDFSDAGVVRDVLFEAMRYHPPVTVLPTWVRNQEASSFSEGSEEPSEGQWDHELICLDRALADETIFEDPMDFKVDRENKECCSMAWAAEATVKGDKAHPNSHSCPGMELSIAMVQAFVQEYLEAGPWTVENEDIKFNFYGTKGWKVIKND